MITYKNKASRLIVEKKLKSNQIIEPENFNEFISNLKGKKIIVDKKSLFYILGTELDFSDGLNGKGFQFKNPNATRTCGCGESFSV